MEEKTLDTIVVETRPTFVLDELRDIYYAQPRKKNPYMKPSIIRQGPKKKRNEACECGSGKKYKKCCAI